MGHCEIFAGARRPRVKLFRVTVMGVSCKGFLSAFGRDPRGKENEAVSGYTYPTVEHGEIEIE